MTTHPIASSADEVTRDDSGETWRGMRAVGYVYDKEVPNPPFSGGKLRSFATHWSTVKEAERVYRESDVRKMLDEAIASHTAQDKAVSDQKARDLAHLTAYGADANGDGSDVFTFKLEHIKALANRDNVSIDPRFATAHYEHDLIATSPQLPVAQMSGDADDNAPWLTQAHLLCTEAGVPQGAIGWRLEVLRGLVLPSNAVQDAPVNVPVGYASEVEYLREKIKEKDTTIKAHQTYIDRLKAELAATVPQVAQSVPSSMQQWKDTYLPQAAAQERMENDPATEIARRTLEVLHVGTPSPMPMDAAMSMLEQGLKPARDALSKSPVLRGDYDGQWSGGFGNMPTKSTAPQPEAASPSIVPTYPISYVLTDAEHLAAHSESFLAYLNEHADPEECTINPDESYGDHTHSIRTAIHEFRKRRDRYNESLLTTASNAGEAAQGVDK